MKAIYGVTTAVIAGLVVTACTVHQTEAPGLTGPSGLAQTLTISATPDTITQNGVATSTITVTAIGPGGQPASGVQLRLDTLVNGLPADFGTVSNRNLVTNSGGIATATYTAPPAPPNGAINGTCQTGDGRTLAGPCVTLAVSPISNAFGPGTLTTAVSIHLLPVDVIPVAGAPVASFTSSATSVGVGVVVQFNASGSTAAAGHTIVHYAWDWGDNSSFRDSVTEEHNWDSAGVYFVTLTVTDETGKKGSATQAIKVGG
jgi:PKD repeat protein